VCRSCHIGEKTHGGGLGQMMQKERTHNDVVPVRNTVPDDVMLKEGDVGACLLRTFASELNGMRTLVAARDAEMDTCSARLAPESEREVAGSSSQIEHGQWRIAILLGASVHRWPEDLGATAEPVDSLECPECAAQFVRFSVRPVNQFGPQIPARNGAKKDHCSLRLTGS
jgi:hypothetical protein